MIQGHGQAERLLLEGINLKALDPAALDEMLASGGEGIEAARRVHMNRFLGPGRFGRMFPDLKPFRPPDADLIELAKSTLTDEIPLEEDDPAGDNTIPAGFTYFGQFVDHDITFDPTLDFPVVTDPELQASARTPNLDLDSVYGLGPVLQPELYQDENQPGIPNPATARFRIGTTTVSLPLDDEFGIPDPKPNDLPRVNDPAQPRAVIADGRNDENLIIAQLHLALLKFHNLVLASSPTPAQGETPFDAARRLVRWHYQWIVLNDFLPRVIDRAVLDDIRKNGRKFYKFKRAPFNGTPFMPVEFSVAAYRLGHSMIRDIYDFNRVFSRDRGAIVRADLGLLFLFTGTGRFAGDPTLPGRWIIDWRRFFEVDGSELLNFARKLNTKLAPILGMLTDVPASQSEALKMLPVRNLLRGSRVGLLTGQAVAKKIKAKPLTPQQVAEGESEVVTRAGFDKRTPLWFYILKESQVQADGQRLGEVGSRIVGEVFVGLLKGDPTSFLHAQPAWTPTLPSQTPGTFTMADLLRFVNEINPIGPTNPGPINPGG
jgi:hypothetical protein